MVDGRVVWEGGTRCGRWAGVHVALSDAPHAVTHAIDQAARGLLDKPRGRPPTGTGTLLWRFCFLRVGGFKVF